VSGGPDLATLARISAAVVAQAGMTRLLVECGRFLAVIDERSPAPWASFALPDPATWRAGPLDSLACLPLLEQAFARHGRAARFEFFDELWPGLAQELVRAGFGRIERQPVLACEPGWLVHPPAAGVQVRFLAPADPDELLRGFLEVSAQAFAEKESPVPARAGHAEVARKREDLLAGAQRCCLAFIGGEPAAAGSALVAGDICEIAGIGTIARFRRRGAGSTLSAALAADHFARGGTLAWLAAADEPASRVYQGIGFRPTGGWQAVCARPAPR
jgi:ribosomal protein S18 acetylase RimI-like enzyme